MRNIEMYLNLLQLSLSLFVPVLQHPITSLDTKTKSADYRVNWQPKLMERGKDVRERRKETILNDNEFLPGSRHLFKKRKRRRFEKVPEKGGNLCKHPFQGMGAAKTKLQMQTRKNCGRVGRVRIRNKHCRNCECRPRHSLFKGIYEC